MIPEANNATERHIPSRAPGSADAPTPDHPESYPRRILLAVTGLSPQVVTETVYALAVTVRPPCPPTEIHLITTRRGREHARLNLLSEQPGWFHRLCREYRLGDIRFDETDIHVLCDAEGKALEDIRCPQHNERAADLITERVRTLTSDPDSSLHVSIAGGRKTMGFYAGYALSLYGRPQDRLSHVLVSPSFESHPEFYYPNRVSRVIHSLAESQDPLDTSQAQVSLAAIPFVSLRHGLSDRFLAGRTSFSATVAEAYRALGPADLVIDPPNRRIRAGDQWIGLPPAELAFYGWFGRRRQQGQGALRCPGINEANREYAEAYLCEYRRVIGPMGDDDRVRKHLRYGMDKKDFEQRKSKVNRLLKSALGAGAHAYTVNGHGAAPGKTYRLDLAPGRIRFTDLGDAATTHAARKLARPLLGSKQRLESSPGDQHA